MIESEDRTTLSENSNQTRKYKPIIKLFRRITWFSILITIFRIFIICIIYSYASQTICIQRKQVNERLPAAQAQYNVLQPWNIMVYLITAMVDAITLIGDTNTLRELRSQSKILDQIAQQQQKGQPSNKRVKAGPISIYFSIFQTLLTYKYRNRNYASAYSIARTMHLFSSFFVFGSLAVTNQSYSCQSHKKVILWFYLITIYLGIYQLDFTTLTSSTGKYRKIQNLTSKYNIENINTVFIQKWKKNGIKISIAVLMMLTCCFLQVLLKWQTLLGVFIIQNMIVNAIQLFLSKKLIGKCKNIDVNKLKVENSKFQYNLLSMLNYLASPYRLAHHFFWILKRVSIILFFFSSLRSEGQIVLKIFLFSSILLMVYGQYSSLHVAFKSKIDIFIHSTADKIMQIRNQCSICLIQYESNDDVILMPCSQQHIFHSKCLQRWLQQKKMCPLCRIDLSQLID